MSSDPKQQAGAVPKAITPSTNPSWLKLTGRIAQAELQLKGGNLTTQQQAQTEAQLNRDRTKLVEVEKAINTINTAPTTSSQDRREADLNRREGQLRAGENALVEREGQLLAKEKVAIEREEALNVREHDIAVREGTLAVSSMSINDVLSPRDVQAAHEIALAGGVPAPGQSISDIV